MKSVANASLTFWRLSGPHPDRKYGVRRFGMQHLSVTVLLLVLFISSGCSPTSRRLPTNALDLSLVSPPADLHDRLNDTESDRVFWLTEAKVIRRGLYTVDYIVASRRDHDDLHRAHAEVVAMLNLPMLNHKSIGETGFLFRTSCGESVKAYRHNEPTHPDPPFIHLLIRFLLRGSPPIYMHEVVPGVHDNLEAEAVPEQWHALQGRVPISTFGLRRQRPEAIFIDPHAAALVYEAEIAVLNCEVQPQRR